MEKAKIAVVSFVGIVAVELLVAACSSHFAPPRSLANSELNEARVSLVPTLEPEHQPTSLAYQTQRVLVHATMTVEHAPVPPAMDSRAQIGSPTITPYQTSALDFSQYIDKWITYENEDYGFSFEYPAIYDEFTYCSLRHHDPEPDVSDQSGVFLQLGSRIDLIFQSEPKTTVDEYIDEITQGARDIEVIPTPLADAEGRLVYFRAGGPGRLSTVYIADQQTQRVVVSLLPPWLCDFPDAEVSEGVTFEHLVDSFRFSTER